MKRVFQHPPEGLTGKRYWRSLGELSDTPEFREWLEREFPAGAAEIAGDDVSRRSFLKLMGASMALAGFGLTSCRKPEMHLVPFTKSAEWVIPGKFLYYATAMPRRYGALPLVATTVDGRPIKIEGNPLHPDEQRRHRCLRPSLGAGSLRSLALAAVRARKETFRSCHL
jgi:molybdopterin-containing oxidoreductase family iron-sulfur binding subunit